MTEKFQKAIKRGCVFALVAMVSLLPLTQALAGVSISASYSKSANTVTVTGSLDSASTGQGVELTVNGGLSGSATIAAGEADSFNKTITLSGTPVAGTTYTVGAKTIGTSTTPGEATASTTFSFENTAITLSATASGSTDIAVSGTAEPGEAIALSLTGAATQSTQVTASGGNFTHTFSGLGYGEYTVSAEYANGTKQTKTATAKLVAPLTVGTLTGGTNVIIVSGTGHVGSTVTAKAGDITGNATVQSDGKYQITLTNVPAGNYTVTVTSNLSQSVTSPSVTVSNAPVVQENIAVSAVTPGAGMVTVTGTASAGAVVTLSGFGKTAEANVGADKKFTAKLTGVAAGTYNALTVEYKDKTTYTGTSANLTGQSWVVSAPSTAITIASATGGQGTITVSGVAAPGQKLAVVVRSTQEVAIAATSDSAGAYSATLSGLAAGTYTVSVSYVNTSVGASATVSGVVVSGLPVVKAGIQIDKLYEATTTVVGKTSPNCTVTIRGTVNGTTITASRASGTDGIFRIPLPGKLDKHTVLTATVTYPDGTTESADGHVYAGQPYYKTYSIGSHGNDVYDIEWRLKELGYPIEPDMNYDATTANVVALFQRNNGLPADGIAGPNTLSKLYSVTAIRYDQGGSGDVIYLKRGDRGGLVYNVQARLAELGYYTIRVDGIFGVGTQTAVRAFQRNNGIYVTGVVDTQTYNAMMASNAVGVGGIAPGDYVELRRGNRGAAVSRLQSRLQYLGYYTISVDGIYGSATQSAVRRFQSRNGISANGVATVYTQEVLYSSNAIANSGSSTGGYVYLHYGSRGSAVKRLQQALKDAGYYKGAVDGMYYDQTYAAVKSFQRAKGLSVDGIAGRKTQNALYGTNY